MAKFITVFGIIVFMAMLASIIRAGYLADIENQRFWERYDREKREREMNDYRKENY